MTEKELLELIVQKVSGLESNMKELNGKMESMENDIKKLDQKLSLVYEQTAMLTEFKTETNNKIIEFNQKVEQHDIDIQLLKKLVAR